MDSSPVEVEKGVIKSQENSKLKDDCTKVNMQLSFDRLL